MKRQPPSDPDGAWLVGRQSWEKWCQMPWPLQQLASLSTVKSLSGCFLCPSSQKICLCEDRGNLHVAWHLMNQTLSHSWHGFRGSHCFDMLLFCLVLVLPRDHCWLDALCNFVFRGWLAFEINWTTCPDSKACSNVQVAQQLCFEHFPLGFIFFSTLFQTSMSTPHDTACQRGAKILTTNFLHSVLFSSSFQQMT